MRRYTVATRNYDGYVEYIVVDTGRPWRVSPSRYVTVATFTLRSDAVSLADRLEACRTDTGPTDCTTQEA